MSEGLSINKVAGILGKHPMTVRRWVKRGYLRGYKVAGSILIPRTEVVRIRAYRAHEYRPLPRV